MKNERYLFLEHTADAKFRAFGRTLEEAFANAALATASLMWDWNKIDKRIRVSVSSKGSDLKQLLMSFLEEVLFLFDSQQFLLSRIENIKMTKGETGLSLDAVFLGDNMEKQYHTYGNVKAITYNEMKIGQNDHFVVQVVVDI